ncbi:MAG: LLM class flavin-dependent oxidoreductase [Streptomycetales bacterium]
MPPENRPLRFTWSMSSGRSAGAHDPASTGGVTNGFDDDLQFRSQMKFCRRAEEAGAETVLVPMGPGHADPLTLTGALAMVTSTLKFMITARPGVVSPTYFVQQINTLSVLTGGRVTANVVLDYVPHEQRAFGDHVPQDVWYRRVEEYCDICEALWRTQDPVDHHGEHFRVEGAQLTTPFVSSDQAGPEIYVTSNSPPGDRLVERYADCHVRFADSPERLEPAIASTLERGVEVGLMLPLILRPIRDEALHAAEGHVDHMATALVGSPQDVAEGLLAYARMGVSQFIVQGGHDVDSMIDSVILFGREVLPVIRAQEGDWTAGTGRASGRTPRAVVSEPTGQGR